MYFLFLDLFLFLFHQFLFITYLPLVIFYQPLSIIHHSSVVICQSSSISNLPTAIYHHFSPSVISHHPINDRLSFFCCPSSYVRCLILGFCYYTISISCWHIFITLKSYQSYGNIGWHMFSWIGYIHCSIFLNRFGWVQFHQL